MTVATRALLKIDDERLKQATILVVDDQEPNVKLLAAFLGAADFANVHTTTDSARVIELCGELGPDLVLIDLHMPSPDGFDLLQMLAPWREGSVRLPVIVLTADSTVTTRHRALQLGANDFLTKPFDPTEVVLRARNLLETRFLQRELQTQNADLERRVRERTRALDEARLESIVRLARAAEYRDDATGDHAERVGRTAALLARELGLGDDFAALIRRAAPLHDIGKLAISDSILLKRGRLEGPEREVMKLHVNVGAEILGGSRAPLLQLAERIALTHHERWDGSGYTGGLRGEEIPVEGRITAVADVFDALTHRRPYAEAWSVEKAVAEIRSLRGRAFDPDVIEAFAALPHDRLVVPASAYDPIGEL